MTAGMDLAQEIGQVRRIGPNSWGFPSVTDHDEAEHRVDLLSGELFCTCWGFLKWRHCRHSDRIRRYLAMDERHVSHSMAIEKAMPSLPVERSPQQLANRLADMVAERGLVAAFFRDVMEQGFDYGIIPGTDKPTLFKPGAEKLAELYGYSPVVKDRQETTDYETGFYRVVVTMALVGKDTGVLVAEGVGECNTREARYFYRWVTEGRIPPGIDKATLKSEERSGRRKNGSTWTATYYRLENDDLFTLWNTVLKMAKKRALVDAVLSATRSSGIFSGVGVQRDIQDWIDAEYKDITEFAEDEDPDEAPVPEKDKPKARQSRAPKPAAAAAVPDDSPRADETTWRQVQALFVACTPEQRQAALKNVPSIEKPQEMTQSQAIDALSYFEGEGIKAAAQASMV